jgi:hypothetical protein
VTGPAPIDPAVMPADVRAAGPGRRREYAAALGFERELSLQLVQELARSAAPEGGGLAGGPYAALLPEALADALARSGGLGLAPLLLSAEDGR